MRGPLQQGKPASFHGHAHLVSGRGGDQPLISKNSYCKLQINWNHFKLLFHKSFCTIYFKAQVKIN